MNHNVLSKLYELGKFVCIYEYQFYDNTSVNNGKVEMHSMIFMTHNGVVFSSSFSNMKSQKEINIMQF